VSRLLNKIKKLILERKKEQETANLIFEANQDTVDDLITNDEDVPDNDNTDDSVTDAVDDDAVEDSTEPESFDLNDDDMDLMNVEVNLASNTITDTIPTPPDSAPDAVHDVPDDSSDDSSDDVEDIDVDSHPDDDVDTEDIQVDDHEPITESVVDNDPVFKYYGDYLWKIQAELHNIFDEVIKDDAFKLISGNKELVKEIHRVGKNNAYANNERIVVFDGNQVYEENQNAIPTIAKAFAEVAKRYTNSHPDVKNVFKLSSSGWIDKLDQIPGIEIYLHIPKNVELNLKGDVKKFAVSYANDTYKNLTASILGLNLLAQKEKIDFTLSGDAKIVVKEGNILQIGDKEIRIDKILTPSIFTRIANRIFKESVDDSIGDIFTEEIVFGDEDTSSDKKDESSNDKKDDSKEDNTVTKQVKDEINDDVDNMNIDDDMPVDDNTTSSEDTSSTDDISDMDIDDDSSSNSSSMDDDIIDDDIPDVGDSDNTSNGDNHAEVLDRLSNVTQELEEIKKNLYSNMQS
jgi:hypothetical protein